MSETDTSVADLRREMVSSGLLGCLSRDIVTREIDMSMMPMFPTDELEFGDYRRAIERDFGVCEPAFIADVIDIAVARYKACRRRQLDYWGRPTDPLHLW